MANVAAFTPDRRFVENGSLRLFDALLASVLFIAPLFMGGRHPVGEWVYVCLVSAAVATWFGRQAFLAGTDAAPVAWRRSGVELLLLGAVGVVAAQLVPLSSGMLANVSPLVANLLPLWTDSGAPVKLGAWSTVSLAPAATRGELVVLLAHAMLFLVVVQRLQTSADVERLLRWIALAAIGMAALGMLQFLFSNGKFLWVYEHPSRTTDSAVKGTFANQNHLASFLALGVGPLIAWIAGFGRDGRPQHRPARKNRRKTGWSTSRTPSGLPSRFQGHDVEQLALLVGLGVVVFAGLCTFSRGGVIILTLAAVLATVPLIWLGVLGRWALGSLAAALLTVIGALFIFGYDPLVQQMETLSGASLEEMDPHAVRLKLWSADLQAFSQAPLLGVGAGSHAEVYPIFLQEQTDKEFTHAESSYIQILLETGIAGAVVAVALLVAALSWAGLALRRNGANAAGTCAAAALAGLAASATHSIWDFVWFIPACMSLTVILAACACRLWQLSRSHAGSREGAPPRFETPLSGFSWALATVLVVGIGVIMISHHSGPALASSGWERFLALRRAETQGNDEAVSAVLITPLADALRHDPDNARAHLRMSAACIRRFEEEQQQSDIPMPLSQIRDAARASGFSTKSEQDAWINRITGENRRWLDQALFHVRRALELCPLQGEAYTVLAEVAFLHGPEMSQPSIFLEQALRVRPYDAHVLFAAGRDAALQGDDERAIELWRTAFHSEHKYRQQIIATVAPAVSADAFLQHFSPTPPQLRSLFAFYRANEMDEEAKLIGRQLAEHTAAEAAQHTGLDSGELWNQASAYYHFVGEEERGLSCMEKAVAADPLQYDYHRSLAAQLLSCNRYEAAIEQLRWCRQRRRRDAKVERLWQIARRGPRIEAASDSPKKAGRGEPPSVR